MTPDPKTVAIALAREAGSLIKTNFALGMRREWKADNSPVTETDLAINALVLRELRGAFPDHSILAEEGSDLISGSEYTWVCDPLDGTIPFSHGIPLSVFSLALTYNGAVVMGVVYNPHNDQMFFAEKDRGAFLNDHPLSVSREKSLKNGLIDIEAGFLPATREKIRGVHEALRGCDAKVLTLASVIYPSMLIASGDFIATVFPFSTCHDGAAVKIIVEEAGGAHD